MSLMRLQESPLFGKMLKKLLLLLPDQNVKVQKALLDSLTYIAHLKALILRTETAEIAKAALSYTVLRKELIRTVDLGPLQHKIDDGEPVRKGAYVLLDIMLNQLSDKMNLSAIVETVVGGLSDDSDEVQNACQSILVKICSLSPGSILGSLDKLLDQIVRGAKKHQDKLQKQQDIARASDNIRIFLRILLAFNQLPEIELNQKYQDSLPAPVLSYLVPSLVFYSDSLFVWDIVWRSWQRV